MRASGRFGIVALGLLLAAVPSAPPAAASPDGALPPVVFVVRHAEKSTPANEPPVPLSPAGSQRAERLAALLKDAGVASVWATDTVRARDTAAPLARERGLDVRVYPVRDASGQVSAAPLIDALRKDGGAAALVVGHSNTVPKILAALGVANPPDIPDGEYDNLFVVSTGSTGGAVAIRLRY
jgi:phosphohistidine phosphatase SixA